MLSKTFFSYILCFVLLASCSTTPELKWNQEGHYRWAELKPGWGETGFRSLSSGETGIGFVNRLSEEQIAENQNLLNGSGVAAGDVDGDGLTDIYFASLDGPNKLYKNLGSFEFEDITEKAGVAHKGFHSTGVVFADVDGDKDLDLLITAMSKENSLYLNDGKGNFEKSENSGLGQARGSMTMSLADIDGDEDLDLYITNYKEKQAKDIFDLKELALENMVRKSGDTFELRPPYDEHFALLEDENGYSQRELGERDELFINNGEGVFKRVQNPGEHFLNEEGKEQGLDPDWGLAAKFTDLNGDMLPDLYVCNDYWTPDRVWMNQGDGTFKALDNLAIRNFSFYSMAVDFSDINRDGNVDFFVTEMLAEEHGSRMRQLVPNDPMYKFQINDQPQYNRNSLYLNRGDTSFAEISYYSGVEATGWSWATSFLDIDLDGYEDLLVNTGFSYDMQDLDTQNRLSRQVARSAEAIKGYVLKFPNLELRNKAYLNNKDLTFTDKSSDWGFSEEDISHGLAIADFDNDGDLDLAVNRFNEESQLFENKSGAPRIAVRLKGRSPNTQAIGTKVELQGGPVTQTKAINSGGEYLSGSEPMVVFAASENNPSHELTVTWPGGGTTTISDMKANRIYEVEEPDQYSLETSDTGNKQTPVLFKDISERINHNHSENEFDDSRFQQLLPIKLSRLGPGISWIDYNRDGNEDLVISAAKDDRTSIFQNTGDGYFKNVAIEGFNETAPGDQTAILGWSEKSGVTMLAGSMNYEQGSVNVSSATAYSLSGNEVMETGELPGVLSTTGPLAAADYNGDGAIDLFVGGRFTPAEYPKNANSRLFTKENGTFRLDEENSGILNEIGMVTGAVFTDYDGDGDQDLLLSRAWDSLVLLKNNNGNFEDHTEAVGLDSFKGWWNGLATGDFNNDGRPDIIATNRGLNSAYQLDSSKPLKMFHGDFDRDNRYEIMEAYYNDNSRAYVPRRSLNVLAEPLPPVTRSIQSYTQFANATLTELFRTDLENIPSKEINTLRSMLFINRGESFESRTLPVEAQLSAAFAAVVADYDNDGNEDIFLSQNLFALPELFPRQDAGRGLLLKGDGNGDFESMSGTVTGLKIYGEQRGAAAADFNKDGKVDLAVSQNGNATKLYLNRGEKAGLNIQLSGPTENRSAIGSGIRIVYEGGGKGPYREIQAGSGYWSQNGYIQVMGFESKPKAIEVKWFDGTVETVKVNPDKRYYRINYSGN